MAIIKRDNPRELSHKQMVQQAMDWLKTKRTNPRFAEMRCAASNEEPDAIGWLPSLKSIMIECKTSRSDTKADGKKLFRCDGVPSLGDFRYMAFASEHLAERAIEQGLLPNDKWGVLYASGISLSQLRQAEQQEDSSKFQELGFMRSAILRIQKFGKP